MQSFVLKFPTVVLNHMIMYDTDPLAIFLGHDVKDLTPGHALERIARQVIVTRFSK